MMEDMGRQMVLSGKVRSVVPIGAPITANIGLCLWNNGRYNYNVGPPFSKSRSVGEHNSNNCGLLYANNYS